MSDVEAGRCANRKVELVHVIGHDPAYGSRKAISNMGSLFSGFVP